MKFKIGHFRNLQAAKQEAGTPAKQKSTKLPAARRPLQLPSSSWEADKLVIILPIPGREVSPNDGRIHWRKKYTAVMRHKEAANLVTRNLLAGNLPPCPVGYTYTYYWPGQRRDDDNAIASGKAYMDGICAALGIDDRTLSFRSLHHHSDGKTPRLEITLHLTQP